VRSILLQYVTPKVVLDVQTLEQLLLEDEVGAADQDALEVDGDFDAVGDFDQGDAFVHAVVLAVEGHGPFDGAFAGALAFDGELEGLGLRDAADGEIADDVEGCGAGLDDLGGVEGDERILIDVEEVFALELGVLHAAAGVDCGGLDFDVEDAGGGVGGGKFEGGIPLFELTGEIDGGFDEERDGAVSRSDCEDRHLGASRDGKREEGDEG
jgi:hypothetical protein